MTIYFVQTDKGLERTAFKDDQAILERMWWNDENMQCVTITIYADDHNTKEVSRCRIIYRRSDAAERLRDYYAQLPRG